MKHCLAVVVLFFSGYVTAQQVKSVRIEDLTALIRQSDRPLIINFWATWCVPCIQEMPHFEKIADQHRQDSVQLLFVSLDMKDEYPSGIQSFIKKRAVKHEVAWLNEHNADYFCPLIDSSWSGSIPATLFIHNKRNYRQFFEKPLKESAFEQAVREMLDARASN